MTIAWTYNFVLTCSRDGCQNEAGPGHHWCRNCQATYKRWWRRTSESRRVVAAKRAGAEEFRVVVIERFKTLGEMEFNGFAAADIVGLLRLD